MTLAKHHGKIIIVIGSVHSIFGLTPWAFGKSFLKFLHSFFFNINPGLNDFPLLGGDIKNEDFAAFWFVYFGLLLISLGYLLNQYIQLSGYTPKGFAITYLIMVMVGSFMIPFSGMSIIMLPHALFMVRDAR